MQYVEKIRATVESLLFITNEPLNVTQICELAELEEDDVLDVLDWLIDDYSDDSKGIGVIKLGDGYIMAIFIPTNYHFIRGYSVHSFPL
ncbi:MAG: SMC-Scp complex subunit ScpB [Peptococcaceae bacterium]|nr:SMC-Scp complex subunit ScpB [Peptococcaceae bacterium]